MRKLNTLMGDKNMKVSCRGFTLIEMAMVIMIIGLLIASLMPLYGLYQKQEEISNTDVNVTVATSALGAFRSIHGRYPCPASMTQDRNNPLYGREDCFSTRTVGAGSCTLDEGLCVERSRRAAFSHIFPEGTPPRNESPRVIVGALPFRNLNLEESQGYDSYDHKIMYVVTENLTCDKCFAANGGGIDIINEEGISILPQIGQAHFLVMSAGKNGAGAYDKTGGRLDCPGTGLERDNCNYKNNPAQDATYRLSTISTADSDDEFDDVLNYFTQDEIPAWSLSANPQAPLAIHQKDTGGNVAILKQEDDIDQKGEVGGAVRASVDTTLDPALYPTGKFMVNELCNAMSDECFKPELVAGKFVDPAKGNTRTGGMRCPGDDTIGGTGNFMVGIEDGQPICDSAVTSECPLGSILIGVNDDGTLNCKTPDPLPCDGFSVSMCNTIVSVPGGAHGSTYTARAGASQERIYRCQSGSWVIESDVQGVCNCTPGTVSTTTGACGAGSIGTVTTTVTRTCPDGTLTTTDNAGAACVCSPDQRNGTRPCPAGYTGSVPTVSTNTCPGNVWGPYVDVPGGINNCTCRNNETRTTSCPSGLTGGGTVENRTVTCTSGGGATYGPWTQVSYDCTCNPRTVQEPFPCPAGQTGSIIRSRSLQCPGGTWTPWTTIPGGYQCEPIPPVVCNWQKNSNETTPSDFAVGKNMQSGCACGESGQCFSRVGKGKYINYTSCSCN